MSRQPDDFDGSLEVLYDPEANQALLLDPDTPVEVRGRGGRLVAFARVGLSVIAVSGFCLIPTASPADDAAPPSPIVTAECQITSTLDDGTPSGVLANGSICVKPAPDAGSGGTDGGVSDGDQPAGASEPASSGGGDASPPDSSPQGPAAPAQPEPEFVPTPTEAPAAVATATASASTSGGDEKSALSGKSEGSGTSARARASKPKSASKASGARKARTQQRGARRAGMKHRHRATTNLRLRGKPRPKGMDVNSAAGLVEGLQSGPLKPPFYVNDEAVIPRFLIKLYKQAGKRYDIAWPILAAINEIETDFGRNVAVSSAGALGWMQFMPATWKTYGLDADHNGKKDPNNPRDAIFAAARYLHAAGAPNNMRRAVFAYNHAGWYVDSVLLRAERIATQQGERSRDLWRLFETSGRHLEQQVLTDPRISLYECGRQDIEAHRIDRRVLILLRFLAWSGLHPTVSSLECGHGYYTKSGNVSHHSSGNAVDISAINGIPIMGHQGSGSVAEATIRELLTLRGAMRPDQIISLMTFERADNTFAMGDHDDHIHVGFAPLKPSPQVPSGWRFGLGRRITVDS
jgi:membrane-bound lytic murein transglycosylase B